MNTIETKAASINIRALRTQRDLIDKAASIRNKTRSDFMLEAACNEAENVLLDQRLFQLDDVDYQTFEAALKAPVSRNSTLQKILSKKAPWEN